VAEIGSRTVGVTAVDIGGVFSVRVLLSDTEV
jgi:hypothetical protein